MKFFQTVVTSNIKDQSKVVDLQEQGRWSEVKVTKVKIQKLLPATLGTKAKQYT